MAGISRLCVTNRVQAAATVLSATSAATGSPVARLKDQLRSKSWRSPVGWTIHSLNNIIDFNRGGVKQATIASGYYATGAALAAAIVTALEAADATPVWACSYSGTTFKFTISTSAHNFTLLWGTGASPNASCAEELGFARSDTASALSHTGASAVYQSRHWITADLGSALDVRACVVINHNSGSGGTYTLRGDPTPNWAAPAYTQALSGDATIRLAYLGAAQTYRYHQLKIEDCGNALGYSEVGVWFAGPYVQPTLTYSIGFEKRWEELSEVTVAIGGAHFQDEKARRPTWGLVWSEVGEADRATLAAAFALVPKGRCFFMSFDAVTTPTNTEYGFLADGVAERLTSGLYFDVPVPVFAGALG